MKRIFLLPLLFLAACATTPTVDTQVTRYHSSAASLSQSNTFAFVGNKDSLERQSYEPLIASQLARYGWKQAPEASAKYFVGFRCTINEQTVNEARPMIGMTSPGITTNYQSTGGAMYRPVTTYGSPTYGVVGVNNNNYMIYTRRAELKIQTRQGASVFEAKATSTGGTGDLSKVMPYIIRSIFSEFPGANGETKMYILPSHKE